MSVGEYVLGGITLVALLVSVVTDLRSRKILNLVTYPGLLLGLGLNLAFFGWESAGGLGLKWSFVGLVAGGLPFLLINTLNAKAFGMGDVKLMAAVGALRGFPFVLQALLYTAVCGGVLAVVVLLWKGRLTGTLGGMAKDAARKAKLTKDDEGGDVSRESIYIPYGVAIAAGTVWAFAVEYLRTGLGT